MADSPENRTGLDSNMDEALDDLIRHLPARADDSRAVPLIRSLLKTCLALGTDGLRGELTLVRSARALAALEGKTTATLAHLRSIAPAVLRHRLRRDPLDESSADSRVQRVISELFDHGGD